MGQVVPQPVKIPIPSKPAPVQKATKAEDAWAVKQKNTPLPKKEEKSAVELPTSDKAQTEKTNVIRRGVSSDTKAGEGYDFGGTGQGKGPGVGIGFGPGEGGGFGYGSYLSIMRQRIWGEWTQSAVLGSNYACVVGLTVAGNGDISKISLEKSSGNAFYDNLALRAVRNSSPLPPLPSGIGKDEQRFRIQFKLVE
jgi:TonB family protein